MIRLTVVGRKSNERVKELVGHFREDVVPFAREVDKEVYRVFGSFKYEEFADSGVGFVDPLFCYQV